METKARRSIFWALLLISIGVVFLLNTLGYIPGNGWELFLKLWPLIFIIGGLDKRCLETDFSAVDIEVERAREMVRKGRYVPSYDHLIPPDAKWANVEYAAFAIKRVCYDATSQVLP